MLLSLFTASLAVHPGMASRSADKVTTAPAEHVVPRTRKAPLIDGSLTDPAWRDAARIPIEYEVFPGENLPAPVATECLVTYDEAQLYVAFRVQDPNPGAIRAHLTDRDGAFRNDLVGIVLDTFRDRRRGFAFMANPLGVQMDAIVRGVGSVGSYGSITGAPGEDYSWDAIWDSAGRITPEGYTVEFAIPWSALRFPKTQAVQSWGIVAYRSYPRSLRRRLMSNPQYRDESCYLCRAELLTGLEGMRPGRGIDLTPTATYLKTRKRDSFPNGSLRSGDGDTAWGLSGRWGITPNLSLNATINPDFSQIEADATQLDINRRFALFFPEKRPFFLEGTDYFDSWFRAVHTRTVVNPKWGLKLTGKEGAHAIGAFVARDRGTTLIFPGNQGSSSTTLDEENTTSVLRYRRDLGKSSSLGLLVTDRHGEGKYANTLAGVDGHLQFTDVDNIHFQYLSSRTRYGPLDETSQAKQPEGSFSGDAFNIGYNHDSRNWRWNVWYNSKDPLFRAEAGFIARVDTRSMGSGIDRKFWGDDGAFLSGVVIGVGASRTEDHAGKLTDQTLRVGGRFDGAHQSLLFVNFMRSKSYFNATLYDLDSVRGFFNIRPNGNLTASLGFVIGDTIDYDNSRAARELKLRPGITWNFGRHLFFQFDHTFQRLSVDNGRLFDAHLSDLRVVYQFTRRLLVRAIVQRVAIDRELSNNTFPDDTDAQTRRLLSQFLVSYKVNPQTMVFLGLTDQARGDDSATLTTSERSVFFKLGYAWVL